MSKCMNCNGTELEPSGAPRRCGTCSSPSGGDTVANVADAAAETVSDYFMFQAISDAMSAVGDGIGTAAECVGDGIGTVAECVGEIIGAALD